jgi:hypothetical protein
MNNGKRERTKIQDIETLDDFTKYLCFMCKIRAIMRPIKLWAQAPTKKDPTYGLAFKMIKVEIEPPSKSNSLIKKYLESNSFIDDDVEVIENDVKPSNNDIIEQPKIATLPIKTIQESDSEDESKPANNELDQLNALMNKKQLASGLDNGIEETKSDNEAEVKLEQPLALDQVTDLKSKTPVSVPRKKSGKK